MRLTAADEKRQDGLCRQRRWRSITTTRFGEGPLQRLHRRGRYSSLHQHLLHREDVAWPVLIHKAARCQHLLAGALIDPVIYLALYRDDLFTFICFLHDLNILLVFIDVLSV